MDAELIGDAMFLADAVQRNPRARRVGDVVVPVVTGRPAGHRALFDAVGQPARLRLPEQRDEVLFELDEVFVHAALLIPSDEAAHGVHAKQRGGVEHAPDEVVLLPPGRGVMMQQVVEVGEIRDANSGGRDRRLHARGASPIERLPQVQRVRDRIQHGFRRHVRFRGMKRRRELDVIGAKLAGECQPILDGAVGVGVAHVAGRQFLERRGQDAHLHELRSKRGDGHDVVVQTPP